MRTFFISDTHFGHANIIRYCNRPFSSVAEMDETMIANWNAVVGIDDDVHIDGDFCSYRDGRAAAVFYRLNGRKHLTRGNHDEENDAVLALPWESVDKLRDIVVDRQRVTLSHYPLVTWYKASKGAVHLFGHMHGRLRGTQQSIDVGVDVFGFRPVTLQEAMRAMRKNPPMPSFPAVAEE